MLYLLREIFWLCMKLYQTIPNRLVGTLFRINGRELDRVVVIFSHTSTLAL